MRSLLQWFNRSILLTPSGPQVKTLLSNETIPLAMASEHLPVIIFAFDDQGIFTLSIGKGLAALHMQPGQVVGQSVFDVFQDEPKVIAHVMRVMRYASESSEFQEDLEIAGAVFAITYNRYHDEITASSGWIAVALDVTEERETQQELLAKKEHFRLLFEMNRTAPAMVIDPVTGAILEINEAAIRFYGYSRDQFRDLTLLDVRVDDVHVIFEDSYAASQDPVVYPYLKHRLRNGEIRDVEVYSSPLVEGDRTYIYSVIHDITERLANERQMRLTEVVFETADPMLVFDQHRSVIRVNESFCQVTGFHREEIVGRTVPMLQYGYEDQRFVTLIWEHVDLHGRWEGEVWTYRKDGKIFPKWSTFRAVWSQDGKILNYVESFYDLSRQRDLEARMQALSRTDALTGLLNRTALMEQLEMAHMQANLSQTKGALVVVDIDEFQAINDALGHSSGDVLLTLVTKRLEEMAKGLGVVARLGSDEFAILIPTLLEKGRSPDEVLQQFLENAHRLLVQDYILVDHAYSFTISMGATIFGGEKRKEPLETIIQEAGIALHDAKKKGRNGIVVFEPAMAQSRGDVFHFTEDLRKALNLNEFLLYLQPQVDEHERIYGVESLLRWHYHGETMISPDRFIPVAEETGLIVPIGTWVFQQSCEILRLLHRFDDRLTISINVSPKQFYEDEFVDVVLKTVEQFSIDPHFITIEVTEGLLMKHYDTTVAKLRRLSASGFTISIDDFGTGFSSLSYLKDLPVDELKIDKSFVNNMMHDHDAAMIVETIIGMAKNLGLTVIAEGVETVEQKNRLLSMGCDRFQGYLFSQPKPREDLFQDS